MSGIDSDQPVVLLETRKTNKNQTHKTHKQTNPTNHKQTSQTRYIPGFTLRKFWSAKMKMAAALRKSKYVDFVPIFFFSKLW